jgi:cytosine/adenosine deaminase-related metal-dependent hydrolase
VATVLVAGAVTVDGGARLVWLVLHPAQAQALEDAEKAAAEAERAAAEAAENGVTDPTAVPPGPAPAAGRPAPPAAPGPGAPGAGP